MAVMIRWPLVPVTGDTLPSRLGLIRLAGAWILQPNTPLSFLFICLFTGQASPATADIKTRHDRGDPHGFTVIRIGRQGTRQT
jgi:hypothetical protein